MLLQYITNIELKEQSGGASGLNAATLTQLKKHFEIRLFPVINPPFDFIAKIISKIWRLIGLHGKYHFFSERRLNNISDIYESQQKDQAINADFFYSFTQWIKTNSTKPYFCFNDACFATYVNIYNNKNEYSSKDLNRIYALESKWLNNANKVFFSSQWALNEAKNYYKLKGENFKNIGVGGFIDIPQYDSYKGGFNFLFISREFIPKGGLVVSAAIKKVRIKYPNASVWVVGETPPSDIIQQEGIEYKGFFNKKIPDEYRKLTELFKNTFALIHPTTKDTTTLVINELAYFGCPAIATNRFAIPEYLINNETGYLLNDPTDVNELADKMCQMIENPHVYINMRKAARYNALNNNTWDKVGDRMADEIKKSLK